MAPGGFCSEPCQDRWHGRFGETTGGLPARDCLPPGRTVGRHTCVPVRVSIHGHVAEATAASLAEAADRAAEIIAESTTWTVDAANIEPLPERSPDVLEDILRAYDLIEQAEPPEPVKVTREQWAALRAQSPVYPEYARPNLLSGVPVVLVDDPADATFPSPSATYPQVASDDEGIDVHSIDMEEIRGPRPGRRWWRRRRP